VAKKLSTKIETAFRIHKHCDEVTYVSVKPSVPGISLGNEIGYGASGSVWSAVDNLGRDCAVKIFHPRSAVLTVDGKWEAVTPVDGGEQGEALSAARKLAGVKHRNVVRIHAVHDLSESHGIALVMDRVPWTLWEVVMRQGPLRGANVVSLVHDISQGLTALAAAGVTHGDVTADNIGVTETGQIVLLDLASPFSDKNKTETDDNDFQAVARCALFALTGTSDPQAKPVLDQPVVQALGEVLTIAAQRRRQFSPEDFRINQVQELSLNELENELQTIVPPSPIKINHAALSTRWDAPLTKNRNAAWKIQSEREKDWNNDAQELYAVVRDMRRDHENDESRAEDSTQSERKTALRKKPNSPATKKLKTKPVRVALCASTVLLAGGAYLVFSSNSEVPEVSTQSENTGVKSYSENTLPEWQSIVDSLSERRRVALENMDPDDLMDVNGRGSRAEELDLQLMDHLEDEELVLPPRYSQNLVKSVVFANGDSVQLAVWTRELPANHRGMGEKKKTLPEFVPVVMFLDKDDEWRISEVKETGVATTK